MRMCPTPSWTGLSFKCGRGRPPAGQRHAWERPRRSAASAPRSAATALCRTAPVRSRRPPPAPRWPPVPAVHPRYSWPGEGSRQPGCAPSRVRMTLGKRAKKTQNIAHKNLFRKIQHKWHVKSFRCSIEMKVDRTRKIVHVLQDEFFHSATSHIVQHDAYFWAIIFISHNMKKNICKPAKKNLQKKYKFSKF